MTPSSRIRRKILSRTSLKRIEKIGLTGGTVLLAYLVVKSGPSILLEYLRRVGAGIFLLLLVAAMRNSFRAVAVRWAVGEERRRFSFSAMYGILLVSEAIKFVAFAGLFFGESAKALLLRRRVSSSRAASSVVLDVLLYNLSAAIFLFAGTGLLFWHLSPSPAVRRTGFAGALIVTAGILVAAVAFARRWLTAERLLGAIARICLARLPSLGEWFEKHRAKIAETDEQVFHFYRRHTGAFYRILLCNMAAHCASALEVWVAMRLLGLPLGYWEAVAVEGLTKLVSIGGAVVPASIGVYEGGNALTLKALGMTMAAGVALGIVRKLRSILWAGLGFLVWLGSAGRERLTSQQESRPVTPLTPARGRSGFLIMNPRRWPRIWRAWLQERQYATPYHWSYDRNNQLEYQLRTETVLVLLGLSDVAENGPRPHLLDIGCGDARFLHDASRRTEAYGVDYSQRALGFARKLVPGARFAACAAEALCFADSSFDMVTLLDVIEHIADDQEREAVREAHRVLRPGGKLVISTNTQRTTTELKHYRHYSLRRFRQLFEGLFADLQLVGLIPYFPTLRLWMQTRIVWRWFRSRVRTCAPDAGQVVLGIGRKV